MLKLMKYEFRKTGFSKLILLVVTLVAELAFLLGVFLEKDRLLATGIMILYLCAVIGIAYIGLESVLALHRDLNTKQSYMLFLTPHSSYEILGAKVLENGISILITGIFFALVAALDVLIATLYIGGVKEMMNMVKNFLDVSMNMNISGSCADDVCIFYRAGRLDRLYRECRSGGDPFCNSTGRKEGQWTGRICDLYGSVLADGTGAGSFAGTSQ